MKELLRPAISLFVLLSIMTGLIYPLVVMGIGRVFFPNAAAGSLIVINNQTVGSILIGQNFTDPKYFWGRPSATAIQPYNGSASGGSNLGPSNPALFDAVKGRIEILQKVDQNNPLLIPSDLVTASASGLDPHISPTAAHYQLARIAKVRRLLPERIAALIDEHTEKPQWGIWGAARVNVLLLNLALDEQVVK